MAKLSQLLVRNDSDGDGIPNSDASLLAGGLDREVDDVSEILEADDDSDVSTRLGEACEALRNLIVEAGCKVNELEETKQSFVNIVDPADRALRMLEQEKTRNISLARRFGQLRTAHDALHVKIDEIEQKNESLTNEKEELREQVEDTQRIVRDLKGIKAELANDIAVARAMAAGLEHQVAEQSARLKAFTEDNQRYRHHAIDAETRVGTLESELSTVRENLVIVQGENQSLHKSLSQAASEVAALSQRNVELETALTAATARSQQLETSLYGVESDRNRLVAEVNELNERQRNAQNKLHAQFEGLQARAAMAEKLLANTRQLLATRSEEARASDRHSTEVKRARDAAEIRVREIEALLKTHENQIRELERSCAALTERNASLANALKSREAQLAEADEQKMATADQIARLENDLKITRMTFEKRIDELLSLLDHERLERQVVEGALDATRSERAQLQHEVYKLRRATRRGRSPEETEPPTRVQDEPDRSADAA